MTGRGWIAHHGLYSEQFTEVRTWLEFFDLLELKSMSMHTVKAQVLTLFPLLLLNDENNELKTANWPW